MPKAVRSVFRTARFELQCSHHAPRDDGHHAESDEYTGCAKCDGALEKCSAYFRGEPFPPPASRPSATRSATGKSLKIWPSGSTARPLCCCVASVSPLKILRHGPSTPGSPSSNCVSCQMPKPHGACSGATKRVSSRG